MKVERRTEHDWLQRLVGEWATGPDEGAAGETPHPAWTESVRSLHGVWVVGEGRGEMPGGGAATTLTTLGYDPARGRFVGTWIGSMMTHLWIYEGSLDESGNVLTLDTEGPDFTSDGGIVRVQDIIAFEDDDTRTLTARVQDGDGGWKQVMTARYRRTA